jgi:hypothetical protein
MRKARVWIGGAATAVLAAAMSLPAVASGSTSSAGSSHPHINCGNDVALCTEIADSDEAFGHYVGHDEPSLLFYSNEAGSGNRMMYSGILPKEPSPTNVPGKHVYDFEYYPAIWFGMAMCDTQSYPETTRTCLPDSNRNIVRAGDPYHPGAAYMELQFYPPGYVQQWNGFSCSATQWCVALTIDSYARNPVTDQNLNASCQSKVGIEYVNFAFLTHNGKPTGPPNPVNFNPNTSGHPNPARDLFLNQGDHYSVTLHDTSSGLRAVVTDTTTGQSGYMTASAANGFGQVKFAPTGTTCQNIPYNFHPMYSTSSVDTTVPWAAATYNVAIDTEIGHFDYCSKVDTSTGGCSGYEGIGKNREKSDGDDFGCFPGSASTLIRIGGCEAANVGYDGTSYLKDWPNGSSSRPTATVFTSPMTGMNYNMQYSQMAFNTDLPAIEGDLGTCNNSTGAGCSRIPTTDDGTPAAFYPYYTSGHALGGCAWTIGQNYPGFSTNSYGKHAQYGHLLKVTYIEPHGHSVSAYEDFQNILPNNPCPAG